MNAHLVDFNRLFYGSLGITSVEFVSETREQAVQYYLHIFILRRIWYTFGYVI